MTTFSRSLNAHQPPATFQAQVLELGEKEEVGVGMSGVLTSPSCIQQLP